jgi:hypothetical protein
MLNTTSARKLLTIQRKCFDMIRECVTVNSNPRRNVLQNLELVAFKIQTLPIDILYHGYKRGAPRDACGPTGCIMRPGAIIVNYIYIYYKH